MSKNSIEILDTFNLLNRVLEEQIEINYNADGVPETLCIHGDKNALLRKIFPLIKKLNDLGAPIPDSVIKAIEEIQKYEQNLP